MAFSTGVRPLMCHPFHNPDFDSRFFYRSLGATGFADATIG